MNKSELIQLLQNNLREEGDGEVYYQEAIAQSELIPVEIFAISGDKVILSGKDGV